MAINFSNGTMRSGPRVIETRDPRSGCPPSASDGSTLFSQTFTVENSCIVWTHGRIIFRSSNSGDGRADADLYIDGARLKESLNLSLDSGGSIHSNWDELDATWMGSLSAGTHTISLVGDNSSNCWGCGSNWGQITTLVWEAS